MNLLGVPNLQSSYCRQGIAYIGPKTYYSIPLEIQSIEANETLNIMLKLLFSLKLQ